MGNKESRKDKQGTTQNYERFGRVRIKQIKDSSTGQNVQLIQLAYQTWQQQISRIDDSQSREVLLLPESNQFERAGFCGSEGHVNLTYENFPYVLSIEIQHRKKIRKQFLESQMWYLLYNIIRVGNKFEKINKKIGDLQPSNIVINDNGLIKVISTCSIPNQQDNYQKIVEDKNIIVYLAPEQLSLYSIPTGEYPSNLDPCKAEVFSIGLTILSAGILEDCRQIYRKSFPRTINEGLLNQFMGKLKKKYSPYLYRTVSSMLIFQPNNRRKSSQIYNQLYPNQYELLQLISFQHPTFQRSFQPSTNYYSHPVPQLYSEQAPSSQNQSQYFSVASLSQSEAGKAQRSSLQTNSNYYLGFGRNL